DAILRQSGKSLGSRFSARQLDCEARPFETKLAGLVDLHVRVPVFLAGSSSAPCVRCRLVTTAACQTAMRWLRGKAATARRRWPSDRASLRGCSVESTDNAP